MGNPCIGPHSPIRSNANLILTLTLTLYFTGSCSDCGLIYAVITHTDSARQIRVLSLLIHIHARTRACVHTFTQEIIKLVKALGAGASNASLLLKHTSDIEARKSAPNF